MNEQQGGITENLQDFFAANPDAAKGGVLGGFSAILLHLIMVAFTIYSGYHGIHASAHYRAAAGLGAAAGVIGILIIEVTLIGIYLAYFYRRITGDAQKALAAVTFGIGFIFACLGIVGDSQMQAGIEVSSWLSSYLAWGLPVAPAIMALGASAVLATEPRLLRLIRLTFKHEEYEEKRTRFQEQHADARRAIAQSTANVQLNTMLMTNAYVLAAWKTPEVQAYIQASAIENVPDILRQVGVNVPYDAPLVIEGQVSPMPTEQPDPATEHRQSLVDRLANKLPGRRHTTPAPATTTEQEGNSTHDAPRQDASAAPSAAGQGGLSDADARKIAEALLALQATAPAPAPAPTAAHPNGQQEVKPTNP